VVNIEKEANVLSGNAVVRTLAECGLEVEGTRLGAELVMSGTSSNRAIYICATIQEKNKLGGYSLRVGASSVVAEHYKEALRNVLRNYLSDAFLNSPWKFLDRKCWTMGDLGRLFRWPLLSICSGRSGDTCMEQCRQVKEDFFHKVYGNSVGIDDIYTTLVEDKLPFDWCSSNGILRIGDLVAHAFARQVNEEELRQRLRELRRWYGGSLPVGVEPEDFVDDLIESAKKLPVSSLSSSS
jgi:hypothetical protein